VRVRALYAKILGISAPWRVTDVVLDVAAGTVEVFVEHRGEARCPKCGKSCAGYDARRRRWRHLDTCQFQTYLTADVPRVECAEHGVSQAPTPWAEPGSRFTALLEAVVIDWLKEASFAAVARRLGLSWDEVDGIMARAVRRGLARRDDSAPARIGLDETSFQKRHEYVTVVTDLDGKRVLSMVDGRTKDVVDAHLSAIPAASRAAVEVVAMDMWRPYMDAAAKWLPNARVCFDRFHVARHLGDAVNTERKEEHKRLRAEGVARVDGARVAEQARADGAGGADDPDAPRGHPERGGAPYDERGGVDERADPEDQAHGVRVPEQGALSERDPLPPRGA
jgi:transposase